MSKYIGQAYPTASTRSTAEGRALFNAQSVPEQKNILEMTVPYAQSVMTAGNLDLVDSVLTKNFATVLYTGNGTSQTLQCPLRKR
jgi:hypothetical protein